MLIPSVDKLSLFYGDPIVQKIHLHCTKLKSCSITLICLGLFRSHRSATEAGEILNEILTLNQCCGCKLGKSLGVDCCE